MKAPKGFRVVEPGEDPAGGGGELAHVWADDIELDLGRPGLVDGRFRQASRQRV
jgi:hypothetical protein